MFCLDEAGRLLNVTPDPKEWVEIRECIDKRNEWRAKRISDTVLEMYRMQLRINPEKGSVNKNSLKEIILILKNELFPEGYDPKRIINYYDPSRKQLYEWYMAIQDAI